MGPNHDCLPLPTASEGGENHLWNLHKEGENVLVSQWTPPIWCLGLWCPETFIYFPSCWVWGPRDTPGPVS